MIALADIHKKEVVCIQQEADLSVEFDAKKCHGFITGVLATPEVVGGLYYIDMDGHPQTLEFRHAGWKPILEFLAAWTTNTDFHMVNENRKLEDAIRYVLALFENPVIRVIIRTLHFVGFFRNITYKDYINLVKRVQSSRQISQPVRK